MVFLNMYNSVQAFIVFAQLSVANAKTFLLMNESETVVFLTFVALSKMPTTISDWSWEKACCVPFKQSPK
jgi:hypothetical protein